MLRPAILPLLLTLSVMAADLPGSKDPAGMKRYEGSQIIGYRAPKFDEYLLPLGVPTQQDPPKYAKSLPLDGLVTRATYLAPAGRTATELLRNYKLEFQRLGLDTLYEKKAGDPGWFGPTFGKIDDEDGLKQILTYNEADERMLVGKSHEPKPTYYMVFVTSYRDGIKPERYESAIQKGSALALVVVAAPEVLEQKMTFVNADAMKSEIQQTGKVALYGILRYRQGRPQARVAADDKRNRQAHEERFLAPHPRRRTYRQSRQARRQPRSQPPPCRQCGSRPHLARRVRRSPRLLWLRSLCPGRLQRDRRRPRQEPPR